MNHPLPWLLAATLLTCLGCICLEYTTVTKGPGSWNKDNELKIMAGACFAWALIAMAGGILAAIN